MSQFERAAWNWTEIVGLVGFRMNSLLSFIAEKTLSVRNTIAPPANMSGPSMDRSPVGSLHKPILNFAGFTGLLTCWTKKGMLFKLFGLPLPKA